MSVRFVTAESARSCGAAPVPHRRDEGLTKTRLVPDPVRGPVVRQIFVWRVTDRLSYAAIAERLNTDLDRHPPKRARRPELQRDSWSASAVREVLENPKYSGYMVWNRRARKTAGGRVNPAKDWVWSPAPTHEPLVTLDLFRAARAVAPGRERSRNDPGLNRHPQTKRSYLLRSYVVCAQCQRRMCGKTRRAYAYFACQPSLNHGQDAARRFPGHPSIVLVREDALLGGIVSFLVERVLGPGRQAYLRSDVDAASAKAQGDIVRQIEALQKALTDIDNRKARLVQRLEDVDDFEGSLFDDIRARHQNLSHERDEKLAKLAVATEALASIGVANSVELLEQLPLVDGQLLLGAPEARLRAVFDALRLRVVYDGATGLAEFRAVVADDTLPAVRGAIAALSGPERPRQGAQGPNGGRTGPTAAIGRHRGPALTGHDAPDDCFPSVWCPR